MRTCPKCGRAYQDEYNFCLADGTLLTFADDANKTEILKTVVPVAQESVPTLESRTPASGLPQPTVKVTPEAIATPLPTIATFRPIPATDPPPGEKRNIGFILLNIAGGVVLVIIVLAIVAGLVVGGMEIGRESGTANSNPKPSPTVTPKPTPSVTPTPTPVPTPDPTPTKPIVISNPTPEPKTFPDPEPPNVEGHYYLRQYQGDDTVMLDFDVYEQSGTDFYIRDDADKMYGTVHLDHTDKNEFVGYVIWENSAGDKDREIIYLCEGFKGICGKLPTESWYFIATKRSSDQ